MKKILLIFTSIVLGTGFAQPFEPFNYSGAVNANGWTTHSGATPGQIQTINSPSNSGSSLSFANLEASTGNRVQLTAGNTEDVNKAAANLGTSAYFSFLLNVPSTTGLHINANAGDYFTGFGATAGAAVTSLGARVFIKAGTTPNTFVLGKVKRWNEMVPAWIEDDFFIRNPESDTRTMLKDTSQVKGCILLIERNVFHIINGFNTLLGMNGTKIAYGEDTELGYRAKSLGIDIWYDPSIAMYHRSHFMTVGEFLKKNYLAGQTHQSLRVKKKGIFRLLALVCYHLFKSPFIFLSYITKSANWKGAFVASLSKVSNYTGQLIFQLKSTVQSLTGHSAL